MNQTLQCLSQTKELTKYFLNKENEDRIAYNNIFLENNNELQLSPVYHQLSYSFKQKKEIKSHFD